MPRTYFHKTTLRDEAETAIEVEYTYKAGYPATFDEPAEGPEIELVKVIVIRGAFTVELGLEAKEYDRVVAEIAESHVEDDGSEYEYDDRGAI